LCVGATNNSLVDQLSGRKVVFPGGLVMRQFQLTGLLLVESGSSVNAIVLDDKVLHYCALFEWCNWLTPQKFSPRFDTMFYFVRLDSVTPTSSTCHQTWRSREAETMYLGKPPAFLHDSTRALVPPQMYELGRLCQFIHLDKLTEFARHRAIDCTIAGQRCTVYFVPGDQRYDQIKKVTHPKLKPGDLALDELRNRLVISADAPTVHTHMHTKSPLISLFVPQSGTTTLSRNCAPLF
uniref:BAH domain-containing protein n=1 Tax=Echinostoma caproni TaxID=27848 RepID=A0A183ABJ1_9TREM